MSAEKDMMGMIPQSGSVDKKSYVVAGAILSCSFGSQKSRLKMQMSHGVYVKGKPIMNVMDHVPNINIMPFGTCGSRMNPAVASATAASNGVLTRMPCMPMVTMPWIGGKSDKTVDNFPALLNDSTNMCMYCGQIRVEDDGQNLEGASLLEDINEQEAAQTWQEQLKKDFIKNSGIGVADAIAGKQVIDKISDRTHYVTKAPGLGPAAEFESVKFRRGAGVIKGVSKFAGPAAVLSTGWDVYEDFQKYEGSDLVGAASLSIGGTFVAGAVGAGAAALGAPVIGVIGIGVVVGVGVSAGVSYLKEKWFGK